MKNKDKNNLTMNYIFVQLGIWGLYAPVLAYTSVFLLGKGFTNTEVGVVSAVGGVVSAVLQSIISNYADRGNSLSVKKIIIITSIIPVILSLILLFLPNELIITGLCFGGLIAIVQLLVPLINSLAMESMNQGKQINYGLGRGSGSLFYAIIVNVIAVFSKEEDLSLIPISIIILLVLLIFSTSIFPFKKSEPDEGESRIEEGTKHFFKKYPKLTIFLVGAIFCYIGHNLINTFLFQIVSIKDGGTVGMSICLGLAALFELPVMFGFSYLISKRDSATWIRIGSIGIMLKTLFTLLVPNMIGLYFVQLLQMVGYAVFVVATVYFANSSVKKRDRIKGQAYMTMVSTIGIVFSSMFGGWLIDMIGTDGMLIVGTVISFVGVVIVMISTKKDQVQVA